MKYKKFMVYSLLTVLILNAPTVIFAEEEPVTIQNQALVNEQITKIEIEPEKGSTGYFKDNCLKNGTNVIFTAKVYMEDGNVAIGENLNVRVACKLQKKDGTAV